MALTKRWFSCSSRLRSSTRSSLWIVENWMSSLSNIFCFCSFINSLICSCSFVRLISWTFRSSINWLNEKKKRKNSSEDKDDAEPLTNVFQFQSIVFFIGFFRYLSTKVRKEKKKKKDDVHRPFLVSEHWRWNFAFLFRVLEHVLVMLSIVRAIHPFHFVCVRVVWTIDSASPKDRSSRQREFQLFAHESSRAIVNERFSTEWNYSLLIVLANAQDHDEISVPVIDRNRSRMEWDWNDRTRERMLSLRLTTERDQLPKYVH